MTVHREEMSLEEARKKGALAFFGERYGDKVSVYAIGDFSKEVCGGPHVQNISELGTFKIIKEEGVAESDWNKYSGEYRLTVAARKFNYSFLSIT